jgi:hypothetical protein
MACVWHQEVLSPEWKTISALGSLLTFIFPNKAKKNWHEEILLERNGKAV